MAEEAEVTEESVDLDLDLDLKYRRLRTVSDLLSYVKTFVDDKDLKVGFVVQLIIEKNITSAVDTLANLCGQQTSIKALDSKVRRLADEFKKKRRHNLKQDCAQQAIRIFLNKPFIIPPLPKVKESNPTELSSSPSYPVTSATVCSDQSPIQDALFPPAPQLADVPNPSTLTPSKGCLTSLRGDCERCSDTRKAAKACVISLKKQLRASRSTVALIKKQYEVKKINLYKKRKKEQLQRKSLKVKEQRRVISDLTKEVEELKRVCSGQKKKNKELRKKVVNFEIDEAIFLEEKQQIKTLQEKVNESESQKQDYPEGSGTEMIEVFLCQTLPTT